jgi:hypothetical protein
MRVHARRLSGIERASVAGEATPRCARQTWRTRYTSASTSAAVGCQRAQSCTRKCSNGRSQSCVALARAVTFHVHAGPTAAGQNGQDLLPCAAVDPDAAISDATLHRGYRAKTRNARPMIPMRTKRCCAVGWVVTFRGHARGIGRQPPSVAVSPRCTLSAPGTDRSNTVMVC